MSDRWRLVVANLCILIAIWHPYVISVPSTIAAAVATVVASIGMAIAGGVI